MLPQVVLGHPPGCGCARAQSVKASLLLFLGDVEEALDNDHPFVGQLSLERADVLERLAELSPLDLPLDPVGHDRRFQLRSKMASRPRVGVHFQNRHRNG